jgi:hypothetical protein
MDAHPVRLILSDDLKRNRLTVFFRLLLAIPHFIWLAVWGVGALLVAVANWIATLMGGRSPRLLHTFLASYIKYATQFYGYFYLAANPYPPFDGRAGYPVDVTIEPPQSQRRWTVGLRGILALPALLLFWTLAGSPGFGTRRRAGATSYTLYGGGLLHTVALVGWFASLARGMLSRGLRDAAAYALSYGAQVWAYVFLLTDRYPNSDPLLALPELPARDHPIGLAVRDDLRRSRLTVFFRLPLAFPHLVWLTLWGVLALIAAVANWLSTLLAGRSPAALQRFLTRFLRYSVHVYAFVYLTASPFPGFVGVPGSYPVEAVIAQRREQSRLKVAFRIVLALPALLIGSAYSTLMTSAAILGWFAALATGRMPRGLRNASAHALRYTAQTSAYLLLLGDAYPYSGPYSLAAPSTDPPAAQAAPALG